MLVRALVCGLALALAACQGDGDRDAEPVDAPPAGPTTSLATSSTLIAQAREAGQVTEEQALLYRTFAHFGDSRLPAAFVGAPSGAPDHMLLAEIGERFGRLSAEAQAQLAPYYLPPIAPGSGYATMLRAAATAPVSASADAARKQASADAVNCDVENHPLFRGDVVSAAGHFRVFHLKLNDASFDAQQRKFAELVASVSEEVYTAETGLLGFEPASDETQGCNGGSNAVDIYLTRINNVDLAGQVVPYQQKCRSTPSFMLLNMNHPLLALVATDAARADYRDVVKSIVAHELMHVLQLSMAHGESCAETKWFDEGTAVWAIDHVVPNIATGNVGAPGIEDGLKKVTPSLSTKRRTGSYFATYLYEGHRHALEAGVGDNGAYASYLYFQYVARTQGAQAVKAIFDAVRGGALVVDAVAGQPEFAARWPAFAASLWNDTVNRVSTYWSDTDQYDFGLYDIYSRTDTYAGAPGALQPVSVTLGGESTKSFELLADMDRALPARSIAYQVFKVSDEAVRSVSLANAYAKAAGGAVSVQAFAKIGGAWSALEDWTNLASKSYCFDKPSERLEELVLIFANGATERIAEDAKPDGDLRLTASDRCGWDAVKDFSLSENPHGPWSYGSLQHAGSGSLTLFSRTYATNGVNFWFDPVSYVIGTPAIAHNATSSIVTSVQPDWQLAPITTITFLPGELILHPSAYPGLATYSVLRFTAPDTGDYAVTASFTSRDDVGATVDVYVIRRALGDESFMLPRQILSANLRSVSLARTEIHLDKDVALDFIVGPGFTGSAPSSNYINDSTGITARVERVR